MRFCEKGPSIPDELLLARDEGRVVFFCGAGVSQARAKLPGFFELADKVIQQLGVQEDSPVCKILKEAKELDGHAGITGLIPVDRIFGLMERYYLTRDIETEVAKALRPFPHSDLSAHKILLNLATTQDGKIKLVTTNFDRLFDDCRSGINVWSPPRLPDIDLDDEIDGIVYLHGCTTKDYDGSEGNGFVLTSSAFGRAYLAEGWATKFFRNIIARYIVVFIGYAANDPPVQYLLEALNKKPGQLEGVYTFQSGESDAAIANWYHKGVKAVIYEKTEGHLALWETLEAWVERAQSTDKWYQKVIENARIGPEKIQPHERGQVAHIISNIEGARIFSNANPPPPAEWLFVFDSESRYATPGRIWRADSEEVFIDPFILYRLDSDVLTDAFDSRNRNSKRIIPENIWDGFRANRFDWKNANETNYPAFRGNNSTNMPQLPIRLCYLGKWIQRIAAQPASIWWAAGQIGLHPYIQDLIKSEVNKYSGESGAIIHQAWAYLFEQWGRKKHNIREPLKINHFR